MAMHIGRTIRGYANRFSLPAAERFRIGARSYSSGAWNPQEFSVGERMGAGAFLFWLVDGFIFTGSRTEREVSLSDDHRVMVQDAEKDLEGIERKIDAAKTKLCERADKGEVPKVTLAETIA